MGSRRVFLPARLGVLIAPSADRACVQMDEIRTRVIANTTLPEAQGRLVKGRNVCACKSDINRTALHVIALPGYTAGVLTELLIGSGRAVGGNNLELALMIELLAKLIIRDIKFYNF